ncbi:MAG: hypothetical protein A2Y12_07065 [Planctomycetes bacterium GWF2_42_9]|nr:MAG: hypothetical protein A2Y12_07065 [Planctomycetes bacterium GWF2_42_9]HAL44943.1 hypothetical protein [Phycisphaerales bacterium]
MTKKNENFDLTELKRDSLEIDELFSKYPAPQPPPALVDDIKRRIQSQRQRISIPKLILKTAAVAAVVILAWTYIFDGLRENPIAKSSETSDTVFAKADENLSELEKEVDLLRSEFLSVSLNEESTSGLFNDILTTVESQILETDNTFWKG